MQRFLREARSAVKLKSQHVCSVFDVGKLDDDSPYMVMEFMHGADLGQLILKHGRLPLALSIDLMLQACAGLAEAHSMGIVHRDIKPANFFVTRRPDGSMLLKILDFGVAKAIESADEALTDTQSMIGTAAYMSPEQIRSSKNVDMRSDIWSLGVVLYELLAGLRPFRGEGFSATCLKIAMEPTPVIDAELPPGLECIVQRCLHKDVAQRYQSIAELVTALAPYSEHPSNAEQIVASVCRLLKTPSIEPSRPTHTLTPVPEPISTLSGIASQVSGPSRRRYTGWLVGMALGVLLATGVALLLPSDKVSTKDSTEHREYTGVTRTSAGPSDETLAAKVSPDKASDAGGGSASWPAANWDAGPEKTSEVISIHQRDSAGHEPTAGKEKRSDAKSRTPPKSRTDGAAKPAASPPRDLEQDKSSDSMSPGYWGRE